MDTNQIDINNVNKNSMVLNSSVNLSQATCENSFMFKRSKAAANKASLKIQIPKDNCESTPS